MTVLKMTDLGLKGKRVLIRKDPNVPMKDGQVQNNVRIKAVLPALKLVLEKDVAVMVCSRLDRPTESEPSAENSSKPVIEHLSKALGREVPLLTNYLGGVEIKADDLVSFENVRFNKGERKNADELAQKCAALCDVFMTDVFGTARRAEGSTHGVARLARVAIAGPLLAAELDTLGKVLGSPARPIATIVTGFKVSTKLDVLNNLVGICDQLVVGGGIVNTFLAMAEHKVGKSLYEADLVRTTKAIAVKVKTPLLAGVMVAKEFAESVVTTVKVTAEVASDGMILDADPQTAVQFVELLKTSKTILWSDPVGVSEFDQFGEGTHTLANAITDSAAFSIIGGGDILVMVDRHGIAERISHIPTGGGVFFEFIEGKVLPVVETPEQHAKGWRRRGKPFAVLGSHTLEDDEKGRRPMRSVTLPLLMSCPGLTACSGDSGRRPSTCEVTSSPDVIVPAEQNRQWVEQQSSGDPTTG